ncbi:Pimeloyl-ACP methyl ester carboxylesterase [Sinosporangium album]|uniref:Pimeloyl-ACP methyl ester carboxylesterase n=1 Tax=Sinosporangium album TaxID=504805 RepID=A0A1G7Y8J3_9ACTN|nr:alpha/beta hydrolase [Sinosporangium album]SDG92687.1 Pimeloyl-ACP methyl ester carboxylesterase [Sinosporangium album]
MNEPIAVWPGQLIDLGGQEEVFVRSTPRGAPETAVFVHGLAGSSTNWTDLMDELRDVVTGHAVDLPGAGYSPPPSGNDYSVDARADMMVKVIESLDNGPVHLFGNSLGGAISVRLAATRPDLVRSLTLVSPALPDLMPRYGPARVVVSAAPRIGEWAVEHLRVLPAERRIVATLAMCYGDMARVHPERLREAIEELRRRDGLTYSGQALSASARAIVAEYFRRGEENLWRQAAKVVAPTLVIHGRKDRLVDPRMAARAGRTFPKVRLVLLPNAGHVAQMEYPALVAKEARELISYAIAASAA